MADQGYDLKYTGKQIDDLLDKADAMNSSAQVPAGGTYGQVLTKKSGTDFDAEWKTPGGSANLVQSVNGKSGAVVLTADDVGAMAESTYDPQERNTDIFKYTDKVANVYYATLNVNNWSSTGTTDQKNGLLYQQRVYLSSTNSHAPAVTASSVFLSGVGFNATGVADTDDTLAEVLEIINQGHTETASGSVLVKVREKPTASIRARWVIQS